MMGTNRYDIRRMGRGIVAPLLLLLLMLMPLSVSCSDDDDDNGAALAQSEAVSFTPGFMEVSDADTLLKVRVNWAYSTWTVRLCDGDIIESVSPQTGGDADMAGTTPVVFKLKMNDGDDTRTQDVLLCDAAGNVSRFVLKQTGFSRWNVVKVDPSTRYQKVVGFGGMYNPYIWTPSNLLTNAEIDKLYGTDGLGYSVMRLMIYSDKSAWNRDVSGAQRAQKYGAVIFACPWDCNSAWTDSVKVGSSMRKHLLPKYYADYASHLCDYITYMKGKGVNIHGITVQNEPDGNFVYWTSAELAQFIKSYGAKIRAMGVKLMAPEPEGVSTNYINPIVTDAEAMANIDIVATHTYTGFIDDKDNGSTKRSYLANLFRNSLEQEGKSWWMTEHLFNDTSSDNELLFLDWEYCLTHLAKEIHLCMESYCSAYVYWYLKRYYGLLGDNDSRSPVAVGEVTKNGYIVGHYAGYASDAVRISAQSSHSDIAATAYYKNDIEASVVLTNYSDESLPVAVSGLGAARAVALTTTSTASMQELAAHSALGEVYITLPPLSITSVKCYTY